MYYIRTNRCHLGPEMLPRPVPLSRDARTSRCNLARRPRAQRPMYLPPWLPWHQHEHMDTWHQSYQQMGTLRNTEVGVHKGCLAAPCTNGYLISVRRQAQRLTPAQQDTWVISGVRHHQRSHSETEWDSMRPWHCASNC